MKTDLWQRPERIALTAQSIATSDEEHAVSIAIAGPRRSKAYARRAAVMERCQLVPEYADGPLLPGPLIERFA